MNPVPFEQQNCVHKADGCLDLLTLVQTNEQFGVPEIVSRWEMTDEDCVMILQQIKEGKRPAVYLSVIGGQPPVALWVDEMRE